MWSCLKLAGRKSASGSSHEAWILGVGCASFAQACLAGALWHNLTKDAEPIAKLLKLVGFLVDVIRAILAPGLTVAHEHWTSRVQPVHDSTWLLGTFC